LFVFRTQRVSAAFPTKTPGNELEARAFVEIISAFMFLKKAPATAKNHHAVP
jgi:hypothetical protein